MYHQATGYNATIQAADELFFTWWTLLAVDNLTDPLNDAQLHNLHDTLDDLITRIRDLFESPNPIELKGRCPECGWATAPTDAPSSNTPAPGAKESPSPAATAPPPGPAPKP